MEAKFSKCFNRKLAIQEFAATLPPNLIVYITEAPGSDFLVNFACQTVEDLYYVQDQWRRFLERNYNYIAD